MSEPIPESIPTSQDRRSKRPTKRLALTPTSQQANQVDALFANPDKEIALPSFASKSSSHAVPEIMPNVQGSSAGAGSGEFHVYKASRRREYERLKTMDEEVQKEKDSEKFDREREEKRRRDETKTSKNKARRERAKGRKGKGGKEAEGAKAEDGQKENEKTSIVTGPTGKTERAEMQEQKHPTKLEEAGLIIHDDD